MATKTAHTAKHAARNAVLCSMALLAAPAASCSGARSGEFKVLSYNVQGLPAQVNPGNPAEHLPLISPLLNEYEIVATQEDFDWWDPALNALDFVNYHDWLRASATHPYRTQRHPGPAAAGVDPAVRPLPFVGDGLGIMSRFFFDVTRTPRVAWKSCFGGANGSDRGAADCLAMKGLAKATVTIGSTSTGAPATVDVYTVHAEAGATDTDQLLSRDQFTQFADYILVNSAGRSVIVTGDMNLHTAGGFDCCAAGFTDAQTWATFLSRTGLRDSCTALNCGEPGAIDKIAYRSGGGVTLTARQWSRPRQTFTAPSGEPLSDHAPLVVRFGFETN